MPFTIPVSLEDSPAHAMGNYPGKDLTVNYEEDILVGYRWYDTKKIKPMYPFGYGLSYTTFDYSALKTDKMIYKQDETIQVVCSLSNTGQTDGAEVVQLYVSDPECSVLRPVKELKAFKKVFLKAGESKEVTMQIKVSDLGFYDENAGHFVVEPGAFVLSAGSSSANLPIMANLEVL